MSEIIRIKAIVDTGWHNGDYVEYIDVDKNEWDAMSEEKRNKFLDDFAQETLREHCSASAFVVDGDSDE